ncbi:hypothetical protein P7C73_g52, partial [Tremellales sp. Uapishka_1]
MMSILDERCDLLPDNFDSTVQQPENTMPTRDERQRLTLQDEATILRSLTSVDQDAASIRVGQMKAADVRKNDINKIEHARTQFSQLMGWDTRNWYTDVLESVAPHPDPGEPSAKEKISRITDFAFNGRIQPGDNVASLRDELSRMTADAVADDDLNAAAFVTYHFERSARGFPNSGNTNSGPRDYWFDERSCWREEEDEDAEG